MIDARLSPLAYAIYKYKLLIQYISLAFVQMYLF